MTAKQISTADENESYQQGRAARNGLSGDASCPYSRSDQPVRRSWWIAGWHDRDIELGGEVMRLSR